MIGLQRTLLVEGPPLPASLFSPQRVKEQFFNSPLFNAFRTLTPLLQHQREAHLPSFQSFPHSFIKTPGWHYLQNVNPPSFTLIVDCHLSTVDILSPVESALTRPASVS